MTRFMKSNMLILLCLLLIFSCGRKSVYKYKATPTCSNLKLHIGFAFPRESILLYFNNELIFKARIDSLDGYNLKKNFCLEYKDGDSVRIITEYDNNKHIDEMFIIDNYRIGYLLSISYPFPRNWREFFQDTSPEDYLNGGWGYLSIDSSVRAINFYPDTVLGYLLDSIPMMNMRER